MLQGRNPLEFYKLGLFLCANSSPDDPRVKASRILRAGPFHFREQCFFLLAAGFESKEQTLTSLSQTGESFSLHCHVSTHGSDSASRRAQGRGPAAGGEDLRIVHIRPLSRTVSASAMGIRGAFARLWGGHSWVFAHEGVCWSVSSVGVPCMVFAATPR